MKIKSLLSRPALLYLAITYALLGLAAASMYGDLPSQVGTIATILFLAATIPFGILTLMFWIQTGIFYFGGPLGLIVFVPVPLLSLLLYWLCYYRIKVIRSNKAIQVIAAERGKT